MPMTLENEWFGQGLPDFERLKFAKSANGNDECFTSNEYEGFVVLQGIFIGCVAGPIMLYVTIVTLYLQIAPIWIFTLTLIMGLAATLSLCTDRSFTLESKEASIRIRYRVFGRYVYWIRQFKLDDSMTLVHRQAYSETGKKEKTLCDLFLIGKNCKVFLIRCSCQKSWDEKKLLPLNFQLSDFLANTNAPIMEQRLDSYLISTKALKIAKHLGQVLVFTALFLTPIDMFSEMIAIDTAILNSLGIMGFGLTILSIFSLSNRPTF